VSGSPALLADAGHMATDAGIGLAAIGGSRSVVSGRLGRSI
jgi:Co/Zn/Cd efflux system component